MILKSVSAKGGKLDIYADEEFVINLSPQIWYTSGYSDGDEVNDDDIRNLKEIVGGRLAYAAAVRILTLRANSEHELREKLLKKYPPEACDDAIERCRELGFVDDEDFAGRYALELYEKKHYGADRIKAELKLKGIAGELISNAVEGLDIDPVSCIIEIIGKKYSGCLSDEKGLRRIYAGCQRLGYSYYDIKKAVGQMNGENENEY